MAMRHKNMKDAHAKTRQTHKQDTWLPICEYGKMANSFME